jgi:Fe-S-cluster-containing hydrogenase component 2
MKALKVFPKQCVGCEICSLTCSVVHGNQARETAMRIRIRHKYPELPKPACQPMVCRNCENPKCVEACPRKALIIDQGAEQVRLIGSACDGCGLCVEACPFDAIWIDPASRVAIKCDLCQGDPQCVKFCGFGAIRSPYEASL